MEQQKSMNQLTDGPLASSLLKFTLPFFLANVLQTLYGMVDTLVIGRFGSTAGVSAVATAVQLLNLVTFFCFGVCGGSTVLLGRSIGSRDDKEAARVVGNTIIDFAVISVIMTAFLFCTYGWLLQILNLPEEAVSEAHAYMRICCCGIPLIIGYNTVCAVLRAIGDSKSPLLFVFVACIFNIAGDLLFTGYFKMGAAGVAIATVAAQGISFLFSLIFIMKRGLPFAFSKKDIRFEGSVTGRMLKIGLPMGVQSIMVNVSFLFMTAIINAMGVNASAAMGIGDKIIGFAFMPQTAFSSSVAVVVSQNIGAGKPERALKAMWVSLAVCVGVELLFCGACQIWPHLFPSLFSNDAVVVELTGLYMRAYSFDALLTAIAFPVSGYLNGRGWTSYNMIQNLITSFLVRIPAAYIIAHQVWANLFYIGLGAVSSSVVSVAMLFIYLAVRLNREKRATLPEAGD